MADLRMQRWRRLGVLATSHGPLTRASLPTPWRLSEKRLRLYYGAIDADTISRIFYVEIDLERPTKAIAASSRASLDIGEGGHFDDNGVLPSAVVESAGEIALYYVGFQKHTRIPYTMLTGLAVSSDGGLSFRRAQTTPVLERSPGEPFFRTAAFVRPAATGRQAWYIGGGGWVRDGDRLLPTYDLRTASSADGRAWPGEGEICLAHEGEEIGFGRPFVLRDNDRYRMWYSIRRRSGYRLGYAESADGRRWQRLDGLLDLGPALAGFDDEMMCYPAVVRRGEDLLLFYNGNGYGRTGIGVAVLEDGAEAKGSVVEP
jgi:hypothetical protein